MFVMKNRRFLAKILALSLSLIALSGCERRDGLDYNKLNVKNQEIVKAFSDAKKSGKPVLIIFEAKWCPYCGRLNKETLVDPDVMKSLEGFEFVQIDIDENPEDSRAFKGGPSSAGGSGIPATVIFSPSGFEQYRILGFFEPTEYNEELKYFL